MPIRDAHRYCSPACRKTAGPTHPTAHPAGPDTTTPYPALRLGEAELLLRQLGHRDVGAGEANRPLVYALQAACDGLDQDEREQLVLGLATAGDPLAYLRRLGTAA